jgi:hypothetical protein
MLVASAGALGALAACAAAHLLFAAITLAATGSLPDWGEYLAYLEAFLAGDIGDLTYDVARWTPGLALGAGYLASAAALLELARRRDPLLERERPAAVALAGLTAYGIVLLSYYVDRSQDHILIHVALPALLVGTLWLALLRRAPLPARVRRPPRSGSGSPPWSSPSPGRRSASGCRAPRSATRSPAGARSAARWSACGTCPRSTGPRRRASGSWRDTSRVRAPWSCSSAPTSAARS